MRNNNAGAPFLNTHTHKYIYREKEYENTYKTTTQILLKTTHMSSVPDAMPHLDLAYHKSAGKAGGSGRRGEGVMRGW